ncbi:tripartite tricarboxylate transporter TctB family protein [Paracoccus sp. DMF-8]|uniref:tripartite tricarboxylate transporter TctB family protein n=1 Tax=Paracoccus sp. DMF-8 TaxID=3019445 RepID=UPI0023E88434|nr:tripartite tricarboxylate transporter TctB family protein [Paracoccus sp. DMF-8]MDF3606699.1 tripartite tricarboxylate transporter TctB family protein [Paracoccus sp. DMF-8]
MTSTQDAGLHRPTLIIGLALFALAMITFHDAWNMKIRASYGMGADAASYFVAGFLGLLAIGHLIAAFRPQPEADAADWAGVIWVSLGLAGLTLSVWLGGGFILGSTLLFVLTARAFGRKAILTDLLIGLALGLGIFLLFNKLLTLALPAGPLERLF